MLRAVTATCCVVVMTGCSVSAETTAAQPTTVSGSVTAEGCGKYLCLASPEVNVRVEQIADDLAVTDATSLLGENADDHLFVVYDRVEKVEAVSWDTKTGALTWLEPISEGLDGNLYLIRTSRSEFAVATVFPTGNLNHHEGRNSRVAGMKAAVTIP